MTLCWSVRHALGHLVRRVPDDVAPEVPAIGLQGEGDAPGNPNQVLRSSWLTRKSRACRVLRAAEFFALRAAIVRRADIGIAKVQPHRPVIAEHATDFTKNRDERRDVHLWRLFETKLKIHARRSAFFADVTIKRRRHLRRFIV